MKTLDEVIKAFDFCINNGDAQNCLGCPYADVDGEAACYGHDREDAFHYLKEFKGLSEMWNAKLDKEQKNPALTWDELKTMEGKPVWVEMSVPGYKPWSGWEIIDYVEDKYMTTHRDDYALDKMGIEWQAYEKERP